MFGLKAACCWLPGQSPLLSARWEAELCRHAQQVLSLKAWLKRLLNFSLKHLNPIWLAWHRTPAATSSARPFSDHSLSAQRRSPPSPPHRLPLLRSAQSPRCGRPAVCEGQPQALIPFPRTRLLLAVPIELISAFLHLLFLGTAGGPGLLPSSPAFPQPLARRYLLFSPKLCHVAAGSVPWHQPSRLEEHNRGGKTADLQKQLHVWGHKGPHCPPDNPLCVLPMAEWN